MSDPIVVIITGGGRGIGFGIGECFTARGGTQFRCHLLTQSRRLRAQRKSAHRSWAVHETLEEALVCSR